MNDNTEPNDSPRDWSERWKLLEAFGKGGQSYTHKVVLKHSGDATIRFLKVLKVQQRDDLRDRFRREVTAYATLDHPAIPKLIDSNSELFRDAKAKLYLVTELVDGITLEEWVREQGSQPLNVAASVAIQLLNIVGHCHAAELVHRDIKPDNIILEGSDPTRLKLVDFGLSFNATETDVAETASMQELGNRFLRLPEFAPGSANKRDPRSDITLCAGVFFFLLTGAYPATLQDERSRFPHQREPARTIFSETLTGQQSHRVLAIFDRAFQTDIAHRWQFAEDLKNAIANATSATQDSNEMDLVRERIASYMSQPQREHSDRLREKLRHELKRMEAIAQNFSKAYTPTFGWSQTGFNTQPFAVEIWYGFKTPDRGAPHAWVQLRVEAIGDDFVYKSIMGEDAVTIARMPMSQGATDNQLLPAIENMFARQLDGEIARAREAESGK